MTASTASVRSRPVSSGYFAEIWRRRDFIWYSALADIRAKHANTALGLAWWMVNPLLLGAVYFFVFGVLLETSKGQPNYIGYLLSGLFAFTYTRNLLTGGPRSITSNSSIIAARSFPRLILPITAVIQSAIGFIASLGPLMLIAGATNGDWPGPHTIVLIPIFVLHTLFNMGLGTIFARLVVPIPDIGEMMQFISRLWLYTSPVIFPIEERLADLNHTLFVIFSFNPLVSILGVYRGALLGSPIEPMHWVGSILWSVGLFVIGVTVFVRNEERLVRHVL